MKTPKVSICVPVYNNEKYISIFIDSVFRQSFNDYELIMVDNRSTDNSFSILKSYAKQFPKKIRIYQTEKHGGPGKGRQLAFEKSKGDYIFWCDSDDIIDPFSIEILYKEAVKYKAEIVSGSAIQVNEIDEEVIDVFPIQQKSDGLLSIERAIVEERPQFWFQLFSRDFITQNQSIPEEVILDDVRYITVLRTRAKKIRTINYPVYYWFMRGSSTTNAVKKALCKDLADADTYILEHGEKKYLKELQHLVGVRETWNLEFRWPYFDIFVSWIEDNRDWIFNNPQLIRDRNTFNTLRWAEGLAGHAMPNIIYVDGFCGQPTKERIAELKEKVFHDGCKLVVLSEKNCDIAENPYIKRAYDRGDLTLVAGYFALKNIYEHGGIFIHNNIRILNPFGYLKYQNAFFSLIDEKTYSEWIFGAPAKSEVIEAILKTYSDQWDKKSKYFPLSERIAIILTAKYAIPFDGNPRLFGDEVSVLSPDLSVVDTRFGSETKKCAFEHDFSAYAAEDGYVTIPRSALKTMLSKAARVPPQGRTPREIELEQRWAELERSNTYRIMMKIRKIGDGPLGPFLKRIYHGLLKLRERIKS